MQTPTPITVYNCCNKDGKTDALLLRTTPAGIRHVQMPWGAIVRFNKIGYEMGNEHSHLCLPAIESAK